MQNIEKIFTRIKSVRQDNNLTQEEFAAKIGLSRGNYSQIELGKQYPRLETLSLVARNFNISYKWLIDGEGEKQKNNEPQYEPQYEPQSKNEGTSPRLLHPGAEIVPVVTDDKGNSLIPVLDIAAAAGLPQNIDNAQYLKGRAVFSVPWPQFKSGDYVIIQISGDSMHPTVYHGDWVFAKRLYDYGDIKDGYVHIVVTADSVVCKRVYDRIQKKHTLVLGSDNPAYPSYDEPVQTVLAVYKVEHRLTAVLRNENTDIKKEITHLKEQIDSINIRLSGIQTLPKSNPK